MRMKLSFFMLKPLPLSTKNSSKRIGRMAKLNSRQLQKAHADLKNDARQRIAERGILQFRADAETVLAVLDAADKQNVPVGALLRQWVQEKLMLTGAEEKAPDLVERISVLEEAVSDLRRKLKK
jgi:hypothetical protein